MARGALVRFQLAGVVAAGTGGRGAQSLRKGCCRGGSGRGTGSLWSRAGRVAVVVGGLVLRFRARWGYCSRGSCRGGARPRRRGTVVWVFPVYCAKKHSAVSDDATLRGAGRHLLSA